MFKNEYEHEQKSAKRVVYCLVNWFSLNIDECMWMHWMADKQVEKPHSDKHWHRCKCRRARAHTPYAWWSNTNCIMICDRCKWWSAGVRTNKKNEIKKWMLRMSCAVIFCLSYRLKGKKWFSHWKLHIKRNVTVNVWMNDHNTRCV